MAPTLVFARTAPPAKHLYRHDARAPRNAYNAGAIIARRGGDACCQRAMPIVVAGVVVVRVEIIARNNLVRKVRVVSRIG